MAPVRLATESLQRKKRPVKLAQQCQYGTEKILNLRRPSGVETFKTNLEGF
jgi:hypothetical protein